MSKTPTSEHSVDSAGYVAVTPARRCDIAAALTKEMTLAKKPLRNGVLRKRSRIRIRHHAGTAAATVFIGGDGVSSGTAYPLKIGQTLDLPISPSVLVFFQVDGAIMDSEIRTLELG